MRRRLLIAVPALLTLCLTAGSAQAVVVDTQTGEYGVALVPSAREGQSTTLSYLGHAGLSAVSSTGSCVDPAAQSEADLLPSASWPLSASLQPLCWHGSGADTAKTDGETVMHQNETFTLEWEASAPNNYWSGTKSYVEQFLSDVASARDSLTSPYADTTQYWDGTSSQSRAANESLFGGGCDDNGTAQCQFGSAGGSGPGNPLANYNHSSCVSGNDYYSQGPGGGWTTVPNNLCVTDADIQHEVTSMIDGDGLIAHGEPGYTPVVLVLTPPGVVVCLDSGGKVCSANSDGNPSDPVHATAQFCSYHSEVLDPATSQEVAYVVQPWTAFTGCDEPDVPAVPSNPTPPQLSTQAGERLVSPLSQSELAAIVNPWFNGWFGQNGLEIDDQNACQPLTNGLDTFSINGNAYYLQREFTSSAVISSDPNTYSGCLPNVVLAPTFIVPSAINLGDTVDLDGSATASSLLVPDANYKWDFGDGTTGTGPSVAHTYTTAGTYTIKLTVTDRGGNVASLSQAIQVLTSSGQPPVTTTPPTSQSSPPPSPGLQAKLQLMPQSLRNALRHGISLQVSSNEAADGFATVWISRKAARRAHIKTGKQAVVVIGRGTVSGIKAGAVMLDLHIARATARKLAHLKHVTITVHMVLVGPGGTHQAIDVAGTY